MDANRIGWSAGGLAFLVMSFFFFFFGQSAIGVAFLALGVVFLGNGARGHKVTKT